MPDIYLDADACPVKEEAIRVTIRYKLNLFIVSNGGIRPQHHPLIKYIFVSQEPDAADLWILENIKKNDIVITYDLPLAKEVLCNSASVIRPNGYIFSENNINTSLATRNLMAEIRSENPLFQNKNKPFSKGDKFKFLNSLELEIQRALTRKSE